MSLQKRLVALVALLLVIGLAVADVVTYTSVRSFLYGQADNTLAQNEALGFNYLTFAAARGLPVNQADLSRRVSADVYVILLDRVGHVALTRPSGPPAHPDPAPILTKGIPVQQVPDIYSRVRVGRYAGTFRPDPDAVVLRSTGDPDGAYRTVAVTVPQGTLITSLSLNPTNDTLSSLERIEVVASLDRVQAWCGGQLAADHERSWAWHQSFTDPAHRAAVAALRRQRVAVLRRPAEPEVQVRALADYDTALGVDGGVA